MKNSLQPLYLVQAAHHAAAAEEEQDKDNHHESPVTAADSVFPLVCKSLGLWSP